MLWSLKQCHQLATLLQVNRNMKGFMMKHLKPLS